MQYDVLVVGGGPGGLQAALTLGRARKRVLVCDGSPRRNAAATHIHNFVSRDGTPPDEFRAAARAQLAEYPNVEIVDERVDSITGSRGAFQVRVGARTFVARRILLATGMVDQMLPIEGAAMNPAAEVEAASLMPLVEPTAPLAPAEPIDVVPASAVLPTTPTPDMAGATMTVPRLSSTNYLAAMHRACRAVTVWA